MARRYQEYFRAYVKSGIENELLDPEIGRFDLDRLAAALKPERDLQFDYLGLQTLYDRYFLHAAGTRFELPQAFFMRVACGVALREIDREERAIEFYDLLSSFDFMASTPTLFNAGTLRPQLSSCFLTTVPDDLDGIFKAIRDNALLSKYAGGLGNDWTRVRGLGAHIKWAISGSVDLAAERGRYPSFEGSLWSRGILPLTRSRSSMKHAVAQLISTAQADSIGRRCGSASQRSVCATLIRWRSRRRLRSPTFVACRNRLNPPTRTFTSNQT